MTADHQGESHSADVPGGSGRFWQVVGGATGARSAVAAAYASTGGSAAVARIAAAAAYASTGGGATAAKCAAALAAKKSPD